MTFHEVSLVLLAVVIIGSAWTTTNLIRIVQEEQINRVTEELLKVPVCRSPYNGGRIRCSRKC